MDMNDVDNSLHKIEQMVLVAVNAHESLMGSDSAPGFFQMPAEDSELLSFSVYDLLKRVRALRAELQHPETAKAPVLSSSGRTGPQRLDLRQPAGSRPAGFLSEKSRAQNLARSLRRTETPTDRHRKK
jgi:hypothetical protein